MSESSRGLRPVLFRVLRALFRAVPMREATRDRLRVRALDRFPGLAPGAPRGQLVVGTGVQPRMFDRADHRAIGWRPPRSAPLPSPLPATLVAFYLPQFHPIPENDAAWGKGFTEWRNVSRALPQFEGHAQPRLPGDLGFYDLRLPEVMHQQMRLARSHGIGAFCFYFYWFGGRTLLEAPLRQWLADPALDLPFCLCWANEKWSRRWDGRGDDILVDQQHSPADDLAFIAHVADYLRDRRCLRVEGRPLLLVYRPGLLPDPKATAARWRTWCRDSGIGEIHLACVQGFERPPPADIGFDSAVEFPPNMANAPDITASQRLLNPGFSGHVRDWRALAREFAGRPLAAGTFPGVNCGWDNQPRRPGSGTAWLHASPRGYRDWLEATIRTRLAQAPATRRLVFINAWNEWAEGAVLEPDARLGHAWLDATAQALERCAPAAAAAPASRPCAVVHAWYPELLDDIVAALRASGIDWRLLVTTAPEREAAVRERLQRLGADAEIEVAANRGRDILPFLRVADRLLDEGVEVVLKLHTKRSAHRGDGDAWRGELLDRLLAPRRAGTLLQALSGDPSLGLIAPEGHVQPLDYFWGANAGTVAHLAARLGIPPADTARDRFIAGSMFWLRLPALRPLLDAHLGEWEFEDEAGQVDGTLAHGIERIVALAAAAAGYRMASAASLCGEPEPEGEYAYAHKDPGV